MLIKYTHLDLCNMASKLLMRNGYSVILQEVVSMANEQPDVLAFKNTASVMFEIKVSRSDFLVDRKKYWRRKEERGMGNYRYYVTPKGLVDKKEIPQGWGLIEFDDSGNESFVVGNNLSYHSLFGDVIYKKANTDNELMHLLTAFRKSNNKESKNKNYKIYCLDDGGFE